MGFTQMPGGTPKWERQQKLDAKVEKARAKVDAMAAAKVLEWDVENNRQGFKVKQPTTAKKSSKPNVRLGGDYEWGIKDYILAPIGFTVGGLGALP